MRKGNPKGIQNNLSPTEKRSNNKNAKQKMPGYTTGHFKYHQR